MIQFKFRRLEIPPNYSVDHLGTLSAKIICNIFLIYVDFHRNATFRKKMYCGKNHIFGGQLWRERGGIEN